LSVHRPDPAREITRTQAMTEVVRLKRSGMTYDDITAKTGVPRGTAAAWVRAALRQATLERSHEAELLRTEQVERLETLLEAVWKAALEGSPVHVAEARRLIVAIADIQGVRQPIQFQWGVSDVQRALAAVERAIAERTAGASGQPVVIDGEAAPA